MRIAQCAGYSGQCALCIEHVGQYLPAFFNVGEKAFASDADPALQGRHLAEVGDVSEPTVVLQGVEGSQS